MLISQMMLIIPVSCQKMQAKKVPHFPRKDIAHEKSLLRPAEQEFRQIAGGLYVL